MAHGRDKPGREKRKPKKEKSVGKSGRDIEVVQHIQNHGQTPEQRDKA